MISSSPDADHFGPTLRLDVDWRWHRPKRRSNSSKGEPSEHERPVRSETAAGVTSSPVNLLPYPDRQFQRIDCGTVFAYVRNDEGLVRELARVASPGATISLRVPAKGLLAGFDAYNLHRYLVDTTRRGLRPFETADIGWRRHYSEHDLIELFALPGLIGVEQRRSGLAASEAVRFTGFLLFRWLRASRNRYRQVGALAEQVMHIEHRYAWRHGFWLDATFRKD